MLAVRQQTTLRPWLFLSPALALILLFIVLPFLLTVAFSFTDQRLVPNPNVPTEWIGWRNYARVFENEDFVRTLLNTAYFTVLVVPLQCGLGLAVAMLINTKLPMRQLFRGIYFLPTVISMVVVSVIWFSLFQMSGFFNTLLNALTFGLVDPVDWLGNPATAMPALVLMSAWQGFPFQMVVYLAGLQSINTDLYEAARLDGANRWNEFWHITIPGLLNTHILVVMTTTILAFKLFTQVELLTKGGPSGVTDTLVRFIYLTGFRQGKVGIAAAAAVVFFLIVLAISLVQRRLVKEERAVE
ncbi:sugar ABC transporter permease [Sphaerotilus montanus]|uniref:Multiple sugar transport system permease protein n=1 Tax=Sphaerotilus montanus TaxID=522889 RepID=A0A7Y9QZH6_9BURK|nr:sugar ABC transporter permease [Sphaerotilus montanus]NYG33676.1 multiple sugar transport system permease protein [Sphaerotilus montanus]NZD56606.1 sugar ABC transporter permease [Sphaerotilus montanus]